jgi:hypothetical protein
MDADNGIVLEGDVNILRAEPGTRQPRPAAMPQELGSLTRNPTDWARTQERDGRGWERCGEGGEVKETEASVVDRELSDRGGHMHGILE